MCRYLLRRILLVVPTLVGAAALVFLLMRLIPGDICAVRLGGGSSFATHALETCHAELGLDLASKRARSGQILSESF